MNGLENDTWISHFIFLSSDDQFLLRWGGVHTTFPRVDLSA